MGALKKLILLAIIAGLVYAGANYFGLVGGAAEKIQALDARFGVGKERLVPGTPEELSEYKGELMKLQPRGAAEKSLVDLKLELAEMQENMNMLGGDLSQIDFDSPNCSFSGPVFSAKSAAACALESAQNSVQMSRSLKAPEGFEYLKGADFESLMQAVVDSLNSARQLLDSTC
ncbi:MAG TPA: hypothetical protein VFF09_05325 [archaeon]|nr:hypothetical protein [archaeon]